MVLEGKILGLFITVAGAAVLSVDAMLLKVPRGATVWQKVLVRNGCWCFVMSSAALAERWRRGAAHTRWCRELVYAGVVMAVSNLCWIGAMHFIRAALVLVVYGSTPLWAALLGWLLLGEAPPKHTVLACFAGFGCLLATVICGGGSLGSSSSSNSSSSNSNNSSAYGVALVLASAISMAFYSIACRVFYANASKAKPLDSNGGCGKAGLLPALPPPQSILPALALAGALDVAVALAAGASLAGLSRHDAGWLAVAGLVELPLAYTLISWGMRDLLAAEAMLVMLLETVLAPVWVYAALGEAPTAATLWGGAALLLVLALDGWMTLRTSRRAAYTQLDAAHSM